MISSGGSMISAYEYKRTFFFGGRHEKFCRVMGDRKNLNPFSVIKKLSPFGDSFKYYLIFV